MGIQGLLPLLKSIMVPVHIKDLEGCCVAVDTYSWLHKGALSCSKDLCKGQPTTKHIDYCMHRVNLLRHYGVKPILVFDGGLLPMKIEQENKRARARKENLARAIEHESNGNSAAAYDCYQKAVDISPSVAYDLIQVLKQENIFYVVAPYEADAQMTFLAVSKQVDAVITEDSDLIAFGCPRIIYKMDKFGQGVEFQYSKLQQNKELNLTGFTKQMLLEMCILSGCDYLQSLPGMGLKKAHALMKKFKSYEKVIKHLKYSTVAVSPSYEESFRRAILTFQHQRVYDPTIEDVVHLSDLPDNVGDDLDFLGPSLAQHIAKGIARGELDPFTQMPFQGEDVSAGMVLDRTYRLKSFKPEVKNKMLDLPAQKNLLTNYFCFASLEAKRNFRAPRVTPKHPNLVNEASSPVEHFNEEITACKTNCSPASTLDSGNLGIVTLTKGSVDNDIATKTPKFLDSSSHGLHDVKDIVGDTRSPKHALLQQSEHSIHKPCIALHKEHECKSASDAGEGKTRMETMKVIVRSSYFQHKSVKDDQENRNEMLLVKKNNATNTCENTITEHGRKSVSDAGEGETRIPSRKAVVRSSYFQHKSVKENDQDSENKKLPVKYDAVTDTFENTIPESAAFGENYVRGTITKRKIASIDSVQTENVKSKYIRADTSLSIPGNRILNLDEAASERNTEEGKFGCNISHLSQYSDIAERSIENFVSVISSFRCSSSGSRASGLRAPLRDVQNTCTNRSTAGADLSKFEYVSTKQKTPLASRRG
ncbi:exonuclease 1 [Cornus florida]|uniref:exonuclease 1 n=1 Tax=Cornus florida TaxID=4283 RepID=UPI0028A1192C|nr:exonuclease 1 [Cornus florida]